MFDRTRDATVRNAAFTWLKAQVDSRGDVLPRALLAEGFTFSGVRGGGELTTWTLSLSSRSRSHITWVRAHAVRAACNRSSCMST